jgi:hypothetical protein
VAIRNTSYARDFAESLGSREAEPELEDDTPEGAATRRRAGEWLSAHARAEFNIPGITFGARYDGSPVIIPDGSVPPTDAPNEYVPTACPGGRAPHLWLSDGRSLFDAFGFEWTLLRLGSSTGDGFMASAARLGIDLTVVEVPEARDLYAADLALIRPDQVVAWRGSTDADADSTFARALGH